MPLKPGKGKEAFSHNVKAEMNAGKPQDQALAIAYSVKRKAKKKMAEGGKISAEERERRKSMASAAAAEKFHKSLSPNPGGKSIGPNLDMDRHHRYGINHQDPRRPEGQSSFGTKVREGGDYMTTAKEDSQDRIESMKKASKPKLEGLAQGGRVNTQPKKYPKMAEGSLKIRRMDDIDDPEQAKLRKDEADLMRSAAPSKMAEGGEVSFDRESRPSIHDEGYDRREINDMGNRPTRGSGSGDMDSAESARLSSHASREMGAGPEADREPGMSPIRESYRRPAEDDYMSDHEQMLAEGGIAEENPQDNEMEDEHNSSIAAAIMAREKRMAEGGEILKRSNSDDIHSHGSMDSDSSDQADLSRNADEDANEEDQASYDSLRKETYSEDDGLRSLSQPDDSNETGDDREMERHDENDRVGAIMRKMSRKR